MWRMEAEGGANGIAGHDKSFVLVGHNLPNDLVGTIVGEAGGANDGLRPSV